MELVVNIWPIMDTTTNLILRFAARAYAMEADDSTIVSTLKTLAQSDFALAREFPIPKRFHFHTEHGELAGAVLPADFNLQQAQIIEDALRILETDPPSLYGVGVTPDGKPFRQNIKVSFPKAPYFVVTYLLEDAAGNLRVYSKN